MLPPPLQRGRRRIPLYFLPDAVTLNFLQEGGKGSNTSGGTRRQAACRRALQLACRTPVSPVHTTQPGGVGQCATHQPQVCHTPCPCLAPILLAHLHATRNARMQRGAWKCNTAAGKCNAPVDDVSVLDLVRLALLPPLARRLDSCRRGRDTWQGGHSRRAAAATLARCRATGPLLPTATSEHRVRRASLPASLPCSFMSAKAMISAQMNPRSKSVWMAPAACGALVCSRICQQRTCERHGAQREGTQG